MPTVFVERVKAVRDLAFMRFLRRTHLTRLATPLIALWKLLRHPDTPTPARVVALTTLAYTVSPVDVIPDVVPMVGMLDDVTVISLGIAVAARLTPQSMWQQRLADAETTLGKVGPRLLWSAAILFTLWSLLLLGLAWWMGSAFIGK